MIYFLVYLFFEVVVSVSISSGIGALLTFFEIIGSAILGIVILMNFNGTVRENLTAVSYSCIDLEQFQSLNLFTLLGAIFLIIPGFLTDIIGILLQFRVVTRMIVNRYNVQSNKCKNKQNEHNSPKDPDVIDVEIISDNTLSK